MTKNQKKTLIDAMPPRLRAFLLKEAKATGIPLARLMRAYIHAGWRYAPRGCLVRLLASHNAGKAAKPFKMNLAWMRNPAKMKHAMRVANLAMPPDLKALLM